MAWHSVYGGMAQLSIYTVGVSDITWKKKLDLCRSSSAYEFCLWLGIVCVGEGMAQLSIYTVGVSDIT